MRGMLAIGVLVAVVALGVWLWSRPAAVNTWPIRNLPPRSEAVLCFGDSLVEGVGATDQSTTYPALLAHELGREVVARGVSGMTVDEGLQELRGGPPVEPGLVIVTLGGNDMLRQVPLAETQAALESLFGDLQAQGCAVAYTEVLGLRPGRRARMHREVCRRQGVILVPDIMDGILRNDQLLSDGVHPNDEGYALIAKRVATAVQRCVDPGRGAR